jgi:hypothetical protein
MIERRDNVAVRDRVHIALSHPCSSSGITSSTPLSYGLYTGP